ncbi:MAG: hypothetical protein IJT18_03940 [Oscillospiraceae bacterium]|nr:hypothetical protein [Oscillospiraceae bacterium]
MADKPSKAPAKKADDRMIYKAIAAMAILAVILLLLPIMRRSYENIDNFGTWQTVLKWVAIGCGALTVVSAVLTAILGGKAKKYAAAGIVVFAVLALAALALYLFAYEAFPYLYFFTIAGAALYLVHLLYPLDFLLIAALTTLTGAVFYLHGRRAIATTPIIVLYAIMAVLIVADMLLAKRSEKHSGRVRFGKLSFRFYARKGGAKPTYCVGAVLLACIAASLIFGSVFAYYCVYFTAALLFVLACYYTFRLD